MGQRLGLCVFTAEGMGSIPGQGTKILQAEGGGKKTFTRLFSVCLAMPERNNISERYLKYCLIPSITVRLPPPSLLKETNEAASLYQVSYPPKREQLAKRWLLKCKGHLVENLCFKKSQLL